MIRALTLADVARELGRSPAWLHDNWERLVAEKKLPPPLIEKGGATWSAAQLYAVLDKPLTREQRALAAAYRAAVAAAIATPRDTYEADAVEAHRQHLNTKFARAGSS